MRGRTLLVACLAALIALPGCYSGKTWEAVQRIELRQVEQDSVLSRTRGELGRLRQDYEKQSDFLRSSKADNDSRVAELARRLDIVVSRMEDNNQRFSEVLQKLDAARVAAMSAPAMSDSLGVDSTRAGAGTDPRVLYDAAYADYTRGRYDLARKSFADYVRQFRDTELAGNAQYWLGETWFRERNYPEAAAAYQKVLDDFPRNLKCPAALLKLGMAQSALGKHTEARSSWRRLERDYPGTEEARVAAAKLRKN